MVLTSEFWLNSIFFLLQVGLSVIGIWIGIYLYLRQQQKEQAEKYEHIAARLREIGRDIADIKSQVVSVDRATQMTQTYLIETQSELLIKLTEEKFTIPSALIKKESESDLASE